MKEQRRNPLGKTVGMVAGTVLDSMRRRREQRAPRALVFDADEQPRVVAAGTAGYERLAETAEALVAFANERRTQDGDEPAPPE